MAIDIRPAATGGEAGNGFSIIQTPAGTSPTAEQAEDTLTLTSTDGSVTITGNSASDTINFAAEPTNAADSAYTPNDSALWRGTVPTTSATALDSLAKYAPMNIRDIATDYEDWVTGTTSGRLGWLLSANSGAVAVDQSNLADTAHPGVIRMSTQASSTASPNINLAINQTLFGGGEWFHEWVVYLSALSDGTDTYSVRLGWGDSVVSGAHTDGVWAEYTHGTNSGQWQLKTASNTSTSTTNTSTAVAATTWTRVGLHVNAGATLATLYINGTSVATQASNIPTGSGRQSSFGATITKSAGTTARFLYVDAFRYWYLPTNPRW